MNGLMIEVGMVIDGKYLVDGICSEDGGMGVVLFVKPTSIQTDLRLVLKYCRQMEDEPRRRFRREVRLLATYKGNSRVAQLWDYNVEHDPPYYVMEYYASGDLSRRSEQLKDSIAYQESVFLQMIDCIQELHSRNEFHRDIKPQNFLMSDEGVVVSDLGLTTEIGSETAFTRSSVFWGTHGYIPPEFLQGGFKRADEAGDIFMLGKTFYVLLTAREPMYLMPDDVPAPIFHVIEKCCMVDKRQRYQSLSQLKQSLVAAYDVLLERGGTLGKAKQLLSTIADRLEVERKYDSRQLCNFVELLSLLDESEKIRICFELPDDIFGVFPQAPVQSCVGAFLNSYELLVESTDYAWSYAETIASNLTLIVESSDVAIASRVFAMDLAIRAATYMNRFAAMDTCTSVLTAIEDEDLGYAVGLMLEKHSETFVAEIEASECRSSAIRNAIKAIQGTSGQ